MENRTQVLVRVLRSHPYLFALALGFTLIVLLIVTGEIVFGSLIKVYPTYDRTYTPAQWGWGKYVDSTGSARPQAGKTYRVRSLSKKTGELIYDVTYNIDNYRRRITPVKNPELRDKHLLVFTCSFAYGEGVAGNETFPYFVGSFAPRYMPYNYGFHGLSPLEMLAKVESNELQNEVPQREGVLIYLYIDDHVPRTIGTLRYTGWGMRPYYYITNKGEVIRDGDFESGRRWLTWLYRVLDMSNILKYYHVDIPRTITPRHLEYFARLLARTRDLYLQQFPRSEFLVIIYPWQNHLRPMLLPYLRQMNIPYLDYSGLFKGGDTSFSLPVDGHPNALAWETIARRLVNDLHLRD